MAKGDYKEFSPESYPISDVSQLHIAVLQTDWNQAVVSKIHKSCVDTLLSLGIIKEHIHEYSVPGSYELPMGAKMILSGQIKPDAIICLGCVIQGETKHDDYINHTIARSINNIGLMSGTPIILGVLTTNSIDQAHARAGGDRGDKGIESAHAALKMISLKEKIDGQSRRISF